MHNKTYQILTLERNIEVWKARQVEIRFYHERIRKTIDSLMTVYGESSKRMDVANNRIAQMTSQLNKLKEIDRQEEEAERGNITDFTERAANDE